MVMAQWIIYLLECRDGSLYAGVTNDLEQRLQKHNTGKGARYTRSRLPVRLVYQETAPTRGAALKREYRLRHLTREQKLALIISHP